MLKKLVFSVSAIIVLTLIIYSMIDFRSRLDELERKTSVLGSSKHSHNLDALDWDMQSLKSKVSTLESRIDRIAYSSDQLQGKITR